MKSHRELTDQEFTFQFANATLDPDLFTHEAHLRLAYLHIQRYGALVAELNVCSQIRQFDRIHGDGSKFNKTVTIAAVKVLQHFLSKSKTKDFFSLIEDYPRLNSAFKALLDQHYSIDVFSTEEAKSNYLEPDLQPF